MMITLTTDFGYQDSYVGIMKGVISGINPQARVVDLTHGIAPQNIMAAALTLRHAVSYFPQGTIHVVVVDPGVGSVRIPILIQSSGNYFIGPDNGVLSLVLNNNDWQAFELINNDYFLNETSHTFHGRDIFAPVAAHLSAGIAPATFGSAVETIVRLDVPHAVRQEFSIDGEIIYIDNFGNLFTNISRRDLKGADPTSCHLRDLDVELTGISTSYAAAGTGNVVAVINSWDLLEIAVSTGSARELLGAKIGDQVSLQWRSR